MSKSPQYPDQAGMKNSKVKDLKNPQEFQQTYLPKLIIFAYKNKKFVLIHYNDFFLSVFKKVFKKQSFNLIVSDELLDVNLLIEVNPDGIIIIDDFKAESTNTIFEVITVLHSEIKLRRIPVILPGDNPPSKIAEHIIYSLSKNQK